MIEDISAESFEPTPPTVPRPTPVAGAVIVHVERDPIPSGPIGWIMRATGIKRVATARIVGAIFAGALAAIAAVLIIREFFIDFTSNPVPSQTPLTRDIPVIE